jgi:hypothetical protein
MTYQIAQRVSRKAFSAAGAPAGLSRILYFLIYFDPSPMSGPLSRRWLHLSPLPAVCFLGKAIEA